MKPRPITPSCAALVLALAACSSEPIMSTAVQDDEVPVAGSRGTSDAGTFEQRLRERASTQGRQGRLAEAATSWEILTVLRPDSREYRERLDDTRRLIDTAVPERLQRGAQALKRGETDVATAHYLAALALQPDNAQAAEALRSIERERNKRLLGKPSRLSLTRRTLQESQMATAPGIANPLDRNELEHAAMLGAQGEFDEAIGLLERHYAADKRDTAACHLLADMYYQKAEKLLARDKPGAIAALEKNQRLDPSNTRAAARLKQLKGGAAVAMVAAREGCGSTH